jgi:signal transduction histidine kinase
MSESGPVGTDETVAVERRRGKHNRSAVGSADDAPPGALVHSVAFRQALVYALLFSLSATLLFGFFYWSTAGYMARQVEATIEAEQSALAERYRNYGLAGLRAFIRERLAREPAGPEIYLLVTPDYRPLEGNLSGWPDVEPDAEGWVRFRLGEPDGGDLRWASAKVFRLPVGDFRLLVGRDMQELDAIRDTITGTLAWGLGITVLMALVGGALMGRSMSNRVGEINRAIRRIMAGDLSQRLPRNQSGDEFDQLTDNLNRMLERIEGLMDGVRQMSDNIAHDLKTPLARLRNRLVELQQRLETEGESGAGVHGGAQDVANAWADTAAQADEARAAADDALREADALLATFGALLRIARIEASARREGFATVQLAGLVHDVAELYEPLAEERGQRLVVDVGAGADVRGDRDLLFQALANLVDNAIKYAPEGGQVVVALGRDGGCPVLTVTDNGPGVPPQDRDKVFQRFWRGDGSRTTPGSGLGLSLVEAVAALHETEVALEDARPGLRVRLRFS